MSARGIIQITPPAVEPVSSVEARAWLRLDNEDQDDLIVPLITAARRMIERRTNRALIASTWRMTLDRFPVAGNAGASIANAATRRVICLPKGPVASVASITYLDAAGASQTVPPADYVVDLSQEPARIAPAFGKSWPIALNQIAAVSIEFVAGYTNAAAVPADLKLALRLLVAHWFENREAVVVGVVNGVLQIAFDELVEDYRIWTFQ